MVKFLAQGNNGTFDEARINDHHIMSQTSKPLRQLLKFNPTHFRQKNVLKQNI